MIAPWNHRLRLRLAKMQALTAAQADGADRQAVMVWRRARTTRHTSLFMSAPSSAPTLPPAPPSRA